MKVTLKKILLNLGVMGLVVAPAGLAASGSAFAATSVSQNIDNNICKGVELNPDATSADCATEDADTGFVTIISRIINIFSIVVGAISVIMIIIGGFRYIISGGDSGGVTGAKNTILYAIVGLVIVLFSQIIVRFVLSNLNPGS